MFLNTNLTIFSILGISVWKRSNWQYFYGCLLWCLYNGVARSHQKFQVAYKRARIFCHSYRGRAFMGGQATWSPQSSGKIAIETLESTGWGLSFQTLEMSYLWGTGTSQFFLWKYQMKNSIIPTLFWNVNQIM